MPHVPTYLVEYKCTTYISIWVSYVKFSLLSVFARAFIYTHTYTYPSLSAYLPTQSEVFVESLSTFTINVVFIIETVSSLSITYFVSVPLLDFHVSTFSNMIAIRESEYVLYDSIFLWTRKMCRYKILSITFTAMTKFWIKSCTEIAASCLINFLLLIKNTYVKASLQEQRSVRQFKF